MYLIRFLTFCFILKSIKSIEQMFQESDLIHIENLVNPPKTSVSKIFINTQRTHLQNLMKCIKRVPSDLIKGRKQRFKKSDSIYEIYNLELSFNTSNRHLKIDLNS